MWRLCVPGSLQRIGQRTDLKRHHFIRHFRKEKGQAFRHSLAHHNHGQSQVAEQPWINRRHRDTEYSQQFAKQDQLATLERLVFLKRRNTICSSSADNTAMPLLL